MKILLGKLIAPDGFGMCLGIPNWRSRSKIHISLHSGYDHFMKRIPDDADYDEEYDKNTFYTGAKQMRKISSTWEDVRNRDSLLRKKRWKINGMRTSQVSLKAKLKKMEGIWTEGNTKYKANTSWAHNCNL